MKTRFIYSVVFIFAFSTFVSAQSQAEQEVLKVNAELDQAIVKRDIAFHEKLLAPEYVSFGPDASVKTKTQVLEEIKKQHADEAFRLTDLKSEDVKVKLNGNLAVVTGKWKSEGIIKGGDGSPHLDQGTYTAVYEKRNGSWYLLSDQANEKQHTPEELEPWLRQASERYDKAWETRDASLFESLLTDDYLSTNEAGMVRNKKDDIAHMTSPDLVLTSATSGDKKFRIFRSAAVETGTYSVSGTYKGQAFSETGRYTTTWIYKDGRWQIMSDHTSKVADK